MDVSKEITIHPVGNWGVRITCPCGYITTFGKDFVVDPLQIVDNHNTNYHKGEYGIYSTLESHNE